MPVAAWEIPPKPEHAGNNGDHEKDDCPIERVPFSSYRLTWITRARTRLPIALTRR